jgi:hypothetical protein
MRGYYGLLLVLAAVLLYWLTPDIRTSRAPTQWDDGLRALAWLIGVTGAFIACCGSRHRPD